MSDTAKLQSVPNITRFDTPRTNFDGWRVQRQARGCTFRQYFGDRASTSKAKNPSKVSFNKARTALRQLNDLLKSEVFLPSVIRKAKKLGFKVT